MRVFVVEEPAALSARLQERLADTPGIYVVGVARNLLSAIRGIAALSPDLVIADLEMGGGGGGLSLLEVIQMFRDTEGTGPRVVLWTGCQDPQRQARARGLGADAQFDKARELDLLIDYCQRSAVAQ